MPAAQLSSLGPRLHCSGDPFTTRGWILCFLDPHFLFLGSLPPPGEACPAALSVHQRVGGEFSRPMSLFHSEFQIHLERVCLQNFEGLASLLLGSSADAEASEAIPTPNSSYVICLFPVGTHSCSLSPGLWSLRLCFGVCGQCARHVDRKLMPHIWGPFLKLLYHLSSMLCPFCNIRWLQCVASVLVTACPCPLFWRHQFFGLPSGGFMFANRFFIQELFLLSKF